MSVRQASRTVWLAPWSPSCSLPPFWESRQAAAASQPAVPPAMPPAATPKQGGTYNYPLAANRGSFDPAILQTLDGWAVLHQMYEGLVRWEEQPDGTMKTVPCLAQSWSGNTDATVWTFQLRRGQVPGAVSREVTAADVVADLRYLADPAHESQMTYMYMPIKGTDETAFRLPPARRRGPRPLHRPLHAPLPVLRVPGHPRQRGLLGLAGGPPGRGGPQGIRAPPGGHGPLQVPAGSYRHVHRPGPQPRLVGHLRRAVHRRSAL